MSESFDRVALLIPAYNAGDTIGELLVRSTRFVDAKNIVVVDDGSTDDTGPRARKVGVNVVRLDRNQGKGAALAEGFEILRNDPRFDCVATLDADLQHRPEDLASFVKEMRQTDADIVIGFRGRMGTKMPIHRRLSNAITSSLVSARTGQEILDSQCGFRLISKRVLSQVSIRSPGFEAETEFLLKSARRGFIIRFIPIETIYDGEKSHMTNWRTTLNFVRVLLRAY